MSKTKTKKTKTKRTSRARMTERQGWALDVSSRMIDVSPLPSTDGAGSGAASRKAEAERRANDAVFLAHHLVEYVRGNV